MKVLMISTDRKIFEPESEVRGRMIDYGGLFCELHVIIFSNKRLNHHNEQLADNVFVYPTNSLNRLFYIWQAIKIGSALLRRDGGWVITSQDPFETGFVALWLKKKFKIKWQAQIHTDFLSPFFAKESWLNWIRVRLTGFLLPYADKIRVVSERIKKSLVVLKLKTEPVVLPIFVSPEMNKVCESSLDLHVKYPKFSFIVLMASRLTVEKNFDLAIEAFSEVALNRPNVGLVIVGQGPEKKHLQDLAKSSGQEDQIVFEDWNNNLECYYGSADLFMLSSNYEGYGRTLVEAGLKGCPILTTDIGLVGEIINHKNSLICPVCDESCIVEKLNLVLSDKSGLKIMGQQLKNDLENNYKSRVEYLSNYKKII